MRDTIELEGAGIPVALITASGRIATVSKKKGVYHIKHGDVELEDRFANVIRSLASLGDALGQDLQLHRILKDYHRLLRLAGCKEGDKVSFESIEMNWRFPPPAFEEHKWSWPSGFRKWHSVVDGIKGFEHIETPDPTVGLSSAEVAKRVNDLTPRVLARLIAS